MSGKCQQRKWTVTFGSLGAAKCTITALPLYPLDCGRFVQHDAPIGPIPTKYASSVINGTPAARGSTRAAGGVSHLLD